MRTFELSRPTVAAQAVGIARAAYEYALDYAKEREAFGRKIIENQAIAFTLADMKMEIDAARLLTHRAAWMGKAGKDFDNAEGSMSKLKAGEVAVWATERAIQILGGNGYSREFPVERMHRDAKIWTIFEGTSEIQRLVISRAISGMQIKYDRIAPRLAEGRRAARRVRGDRAARPQGRLPGRRLGRELIVLLHGITSTSEAWREVMPRLAERYTVVAPDLIGHGRSAKPRGDYSLGAYAAGVRDLLAVLGFERGDRRRPLLRRRDRDAVLLSLPRVRRADGADRLRRARPRGPPPAPRRGPARLRVGAAADGARVVGEGRRRGPLGGGQGRHRGRARHRRVRPRLRLPGRGGRAARPSSTRCAA